jgi:hypothetical protein
MSLVKSSSTFIFNHNGVEFVEEYLLHELQDILKACDERKLSVFVIGALSVRAYGSLLRRTLDLDLAVERQDWPILADILKDRGYNLAPTDIWITATKAIGSESVEIHIALDNITDIQSALQYTQSGLSQVYSALCLI